jgi:hypothetical protein
MPETKKNIGAQKRAARELVSTLLAELKSKDLKKLTPQEEKKLLTAICLKLNITDANNIIK